MKDATAKKLVWGAVLLMSGLYLLNPSMGIFELLPDNLPIIGNLDETTATIILLKSMIELNLIKATTVKKLLSL